MAVSPRGGELLRRWLQNERRSQEWLGEQISTSQSNISSWIRGRAPCPLDMAIAIRRVTEIEVETWVQPSSGSAPDLGADESGEHDGVIAAAAATGS